MTRHSPIILRKSASPLFAMTLCVSLLRGPSERNGTSGLANARCRREARQGRSQHRRTGELLGDVRRRDRLGMIDDQLRAKVLGGLPLGGELLAPDRLELLHHLEARREPGAARHRRLGLRSFHKSEEFAGQVREGDAARSDERLELRGRRDQHLVPRLPSGRGQDAR